MASRTGRDETWLAPEDDQRIHMRGSAAVEAALDLVGAGPAAVAAVARLRAVGAPDRGVTAVMQRVVGHVVLSNVPPDVLLAPVGERIDLPQAVRAVPGELGRLRSAVGVIAA